MALNGTSALINGKIANSKVRGKALVEMLSKEYANEEKNSAAIEYGAKKVIKSK